MPRFFLPPDVVVSKDSPLPDRVLLEGENAFHLSVSLRSRIGDALTVCTDSGIAIDCTIIDIFGGKKNPSVVVRPCSIREEKTEPDTYIRLIQGMPKGKKTDSILQQCTQLGVAEVVFVYSDRSVPERENMETKTERYQKIVLEAAMQCGRSRLPKVRIADSLDAVIEEMKSSDLSFFCYEQEGERGIKALLQKDPIRTVSFAIGPEGGISDREAKLFHSAGIASVTLGSRILRTETAGPAVLSMIQYEKEL